ncbi:MAG: coproporphyrinogen dehydrogenase HemZ, partial [Clostridia bacterium]|nr:coproporphyrinogen dehydrogenase HemZ [Clostridia bacterium]
PDGAHVSAQVSIDGRNEISVRRVFSDAESFDAKEYERELAVCLFDALCSVCGFTPPWGILTGVRPAKLMGSKKNRLGEKKAREYFASNLLVSPAKIRLVSQVAEVRGRYERYSGALDFSLYVAVPFCPSRCDYCSFVSHSVENAAALEEPYFELLLRELDKTAELASEYGLTLRSVYVGGGTPATLSDENIVRLGEKIRSGFDISDCTEMTFEGGRPEMLSVSKLAAIRSAGFDRLCVNPQVLDDAELESIGRGHSVTDFEKAFSLAREAGFDNINCDLIAGLPGESRAMLLDSVGRLVDLSPEGITVHSFALKTASTYKYGGGAAVSRDIEAVADAQEQLAAAGYEPYYLYRQSKSVGCGENVGFCREGRECAYNVFEMEELHSILAVGAGAVTKLIDGEKIERIFNLKYPYEYNDRFDEILKRKDEAAAFYAAALR